PVALILDCLPIILMAFYIWNVFHTRDIQYVLRHPKFVIVFAQLLVLMTVPIAIGSFLEFCSADTINYVSATRGLLYSPSGDDRSPISLNIMLNNDIASTITTSTSGGKYISEVSVILVALICWIAAGLWVVRYFGGGMFL